jgi:hypothetical protein
MRGLGGRRGPPRSLALWSRATTVLFVLSATGLEAPQRAAEQQRVPAPPHGERRRECDATSPPPAPAPAAAAFR